MAPNLLILLLVLELMLLSPFSIPASCLLASCSMSVKAYLKSVSRGYCIPEGGLLFLLFLDSQSWPSWPRVSDSPAGGKTPAGLVSDSLESSLRSISTFFVLFLRLLRSPSSAIIRRILVALSTGNISSWKSLRVYGNWLNLWWRSFAIMNISNPFSLSLLRRRMCCPARLICQSVICSIDCLDLQAAWRKPNIDSRLKLPSIFIKYYSKIKALKSI